MGSCQARVGHNCFTVESLLNETECEALIALSESRGYEKALVNIGAGRQVAMDDVRKSGRWMVDSPEAAAIIWSRLRPLIPSVVPADRDNWRPVGLNERLRFLRYVPGDYFAPHGDGQFVNSHGHHSLMTVMLYLNTPTAGGATNFLNPHDEEQASAVIPRPGLALVFDHPLLHEGAVLRVGFKYAIRTDVMFVRCPQQEPVGGATQSQTPQATMDSSDDDLTR